MPGDSLARGAKSATFGPAAKISQERWDAIWAEDKKSEDFHKTESATKENK